MCVSPDTVLLSYSLRIYGIRIEDGSTRAPHLTWAYSVEWHPISPHLGSSPHIPHVPPLPPTSPHIPPHPRRLTESMQAPRSRAAVAAGWTDGRRRAALAPRAKHCHPSMHRWMAPLPSARPRRRAARRPRARSAPGAAGGRRATEGPQVHLPAPPPRWLCAHCSGARCRVLRRRRGCTAPLSPSRARHQGESARGAAPPAAHAAAAARAAAAAG